MVIIKPGFASGSDYCFANSYILQSHTRVYKMPSVQFLGSSVRSSNRFLALLLAVLFSLSSVTFRLLILVLFLFNQLFSSCSVKSYCVRVCA